MPSTEATATVNPARIDRARTALPTGYEIADLDGPVGPVTAWGYGARWSTDPPICAVLADPTADATTTDGWSASGPGGIVYAVVAAAPGKADPTVIDECRRWTISGGRTTGTVTLQPAPAIDDAPTVAMATSSKTVVEGGTETHSHADTVTAYLGDHVAFVAVVTDPGSPNPQLGSDFTANLMTETVSWLRS
ncbi:DUF5642 family protein [Mycolicibacterium sp. ND9-15]|uniref:DUF5642 family protein n=1 Tax=Mycolicibacterium sp. ND9-15 TaxID=3042320 RepID=UPI002DDAAB77|nr:DUF5642 family protein [Mycolicibacterium sp. ND9-15]WSE55104.1 DUF5642 family protein [Mycolicibacterium sp. ND9-15]